MRYAVVDKQGMVVSVILLDDPSTYILDDSTQALHELPDGSLVGPNWTLRGTAWEAPPLPPVDPSIQEALEVLHDKREQALSQLVNLGLTEELAKAVIGM